MRTAYYFLIILYLATRGTAFAQPKADFNVDHASGCGIVQAKFSNASTGDIISFNWSFGTGPNSPVQNPIKIYTVPGKYKVCLSVVDNKGLRDSICKDNFIQVFSTYQAEFKSKDSIVCTGGQNTFEAITISPNGPIVQWTWEVGGSAGVVQQTVPGVVNSTYTNGGRYNITLSTKDVAGCGATITRSAIKVIEKPIIDVDFGGGIICDTAGGVNITNRSPNIQGISYVWNFANGNILTGYNPGYVTFKGEGKYTVSVAAINSNSNCGDTVRFIDAVIVENLSKFSLPKSNVCENEIIEFKGSASIDAENHVWDFGDGTLSLAANANHAYSKAGKYLVSHSIQHKGCTSKYIAKDTIVVNSTPVADYIQNDQRHCLFPIEIKPINTSIGAKKFEWYNNGNLVSNDSMPAIRFVGAGQYKIGLKVTNEHGCSHQIEKGLIEAYNVKASIAAGLVSGCAPLSTSLNQNSQSADPISSVKWIINTPSPLTSTEFNFNPVILDTGRFSVKLIVVNSLGCTDSTELKEIILAGAKPNSDLVVVDSLCFGLPVKARDTSSVFANSFLWKILPGERVYSDKHIEFSIDDVQRYFIIHTAFHNGCKGDEAIDSVQIKGAKADFSITSDCDDPLRKIFVNNSKNGDLFEWDFGVPDTLYDTSSLANPIFVFPKRNDYQVSLRAFNKNSLCPENTKISNAQIREIKADFKSDTKEICAPATVNIINLSKDAVSFEYFFPGADSAFETTENPVIHFSKGGVSSGRLIATDLLGCRDTIVIDSFNVHQVISSLVPERKLMCQDSVLHFLDKSIAINDSIIHNQWSFGNFLIKDTNRVGVKLDVVSTPMISISVESIHGCVHDYDLKLTPNKITANAVVDTLTCNRQMLQFNPAIQGQWTNVKWLFGDSTGSDQPSPLHRYTMDGLYFVSLAVEDTISGCDVKVDSIVKIRVEDPTADFKFLGTATTNCRPYIATFSNLSNNANRFQWEFGDQSANSNNTNPTHLYLERGKYTVKLIAGTTPDCADTLIKPSTVNVEGPSIRNLTSYDKIFCTPGDINFNTEMTGVTSAVMDWGDGAQDILGKIEGKYTLHHTYNKPGDYQPVLVVTDTNQCQDFVLLDTLDIRQTKASVGVKDKFICGFGNEVEFIDSSVFSHPLSNLKFRILGNFIDTTFTSFPKKMNIEFSGSYSIIYSIANAYCSDSITYLNAFQVFPRPAADFSLSQDSFCIGDKLLAVNHSASIEVPLDSVFWRIGSTFSSKDSVLYTLRDEGLLSIQLIAKNTVGCRDTLVQSIHSRNSTFARIASDTTLCSGSRAALSAKLIQPSAGVTYGWSLESTALCNDCEKYEFRPSNTGTYTFKVVNPSGCTNVYTQKITTFQNNIGNLGITNDTVICPGDLLPLLVDAKDNVYVYHWDSTNKGLSCYEYCRNPIASPMQSTRYYVRVENELGCERFDSISVEVREKPIIDLKKDRTICAGDTVRLFIPEISSIRWTGTSGISCTNCNNPVFRPLVNESRYILNAIKNGCPLKDTIRIKVLSSDLIPGINDTTVCLGSPVQLRSLHGSVRWSPSAGLSNPGISNPIANPAQSITYTASLTEDLCTVKEEYRVSVVNKTEIKGRDFTVCPRDEIILKPEGIASTFAWLGPEIAGSTNVSEVLIRANQSASYSVIASNQTCAPDTAFFKVTVIDFIRLADSIDIHVLPGIPFQLNKSLTNFKKYNFNWTPDTLLSCSDCSSPVFLGNQDQRYLFEIIDPATSCQLDQVVRVKISNSCNPKDFYSVPNVFTPNRDGINDVLYVLPKSSDQIKSFRIFDRFGVQVFNTFDIAVGWDGSFKGKNAPNGVYVYSVEGFCPATNKPVYLTGDVTLLR